MILRAATLADVDPLIALFLRLKRTTHYAGVAHNVDFAKANIRRCISAAQKYASVVEHQGLLFGALLGTIEQHWWGPHYASDYALFSQAPKGGEMLVRDFLRWSFSRPHVIEVMIGQSSAREIDATHHLFTSLGFEHVGGMFRVGRYDYQEAA